MAAESRVVLSGADADSLLAEYPALRFAALAQHGAFGALAWDLATYVRRFHRRPPLGLRVAVRRIAGIDEEPPIPAWVNPGFAGAVDLAGRRREVERAGRVREAALRPRAMSTAPAWVRIFSNADSSVTGVPLEFRWPYMDLRVVNYLLAIPVVPWCIQKQLLRDSGRGVLPASVLTRKKAIVRGSTLAEALRRPAMRWVDHVPPVPEVSRYVQWNAVPPMTAGDEDVYCTQRAWLLNRWLKVQLNQCAILAGV